MTMEALYETLQTVLLDLGLDTSIAELHGAMAGMLCVDPALAFTGWVGRMDSDPDNPFPDAQQMDPVLVQLYDTTRDQLLEGVFEFGLLLPDDDTGLSVRAEALAGWCQGFLFGFGASAQNREWSADCRELVRDLIEISKLDPDTREEDAEDSMVELIEYVRIAVEVICEEAHGTHGSRPA